MHKMFRKSQAAMEFLMTYGWAILVVLVAIGALAYFGVLSPEKFLPSKCTLPAGIACTDHQATSSPNQIKVVLRNGMGFDATIVSVYISSCGPATAAGDTTLTNGEQETYSVTCSPALTGGTKFSACFGVPYTNADTLLAQSVNGTITTRVS